MSKEFISTSISRRTKRSGKAVWVARLAYLDDAGRRREQTAERTTKNEARDAARDLEEKFKRSGGEEFEAAKMTFNQLADYCETEFYHAAQYKDDRKLSGVRSLHGARNRLKTLRAAFGAKKIQKITFEDLKRFRKTRLTTISALTGKELSFATINRELSTLRRMLNVALKKGWIARNPFNTDDEKLISIADERKRERILNRAEERRLLAACTDPREVTYERRRKNGKVENVTWIDDGESRKHLKPIIIAALDTGMRQGEILTLTWRDINFENDEINIRAFHTKTATARQVPITARLRLELEELRNKANGNLDALVFGVKNNVKRSFMLVRRIADLHDFRFHDLRHTAATRLVRQGLPLSEVGRILGHSQPTTTYRYTNSDADTVRRARAAFMDYNDMIEADISSAIN